MIRILKSAYRKIKKEVSNNKEGAIYDFNASNPLGGNGERVDIQVNKPLDFNKMDMYQKSHWKRYEFAKEIINKGDVCGDFACGTGYGCILISDKASVVVGVDLNTNVINEITERYRTYANVNFLQANLLDLSYTDEFDTIVSFETLEHFHEEDIHKLLKIFNRSLRTKGWLIFSTPYMQENSEEATKMGFHLTFYIDEEKIKNWLKDAGFEIEVIKYQNYDTHIIEGKANKIDFIICVATKEVISA